MNVSEVAIVNVRRISYITLIIQTTNEVLTAFATQVANPRFNSLHDNGLFSFLFMHSINPSMIGVHETAALASLEETKKEV
jgi:hypothetical protein